MAGFDPIPDGAVINVTQLPSRNLSIRANTSPDVVGSVAFNLDSSYTHVENVVPYALFGDFQVDYHPGLAGF